MLIMPAPFFIRNLNLSFCKAEMSLFCRTKQKICQK